MCLLISFAAGALLAVALFDILPESFEAIGARAGIASFASGYFLFWLITKYIFHICPACAATHTEVNFKTVTGAMIAALAVHSFMDGLAVSGASPLSSGFLVFLAVSFHKLPEGMALTLVARGAGMERAKAFFLTFGLEAMTTFAGGLAGFSALGAGSSRWIGFALGHVGGGFVFLVIHALLSEVVKHQPFSTLAAAAAGALCIAAVGFVAGAF